MREHRGRERARVMARVARQGCRDMVAGFGHARTALDVAGGASARADAGMIERRAGEGRITRVAGVARGGRRDMSGRFAERVPLGIGTVVAGTALTGNDALGGGMGEGRGRERAAGGVTGIARQSRRDMVARLGHARTALDVAGCASARTDAGMVERRAGERSVTGMASVARGGRRDVTGRLAQCVPLGIGAAVTGTALTGDHTLGGRMCKSRRRERATGGVTGIARQIRRDMVARLGHARSALDVAGCAAARRHADMHETRAHPGGGAMTGVARCIGGSVVSRLALRDTAVMALTALVGYHAGVTEKGYTP